MATYQDIKRQLQDFKDLYYRRQLGQGSIFLLLIILVLFFVLGLLEDMFWFSSLGRGLLLFGFLIAVCGAAIFLVFNPLIQKVLLKRDMSDERAAKLIADHFPEIKDKLLNTIQLGKIDSSNALLKSAIQQRSAELSEYPFFSAVSFHKLKKYAYILSASISMALLVSFVHPSMVTKSPERIINFGKEYEKTAPFYFNTQPLPEYIIHGEDHAIGTQINGSYIPEKLFLNTNGQKIQLSKIENDIFSYTFRDVKTDLTFNFEAAGFRSETFTIPVKNRPDVLSLQVTTKYPDYIEDKDNSIRNTGTLTVPEGSLVDWRIKAFETDEVSILFPDDTISFNKLPESTFSHSSQIKKSTSYELRLQNSYAINKAKLQFDITVIKDQYPAIVCETFIDSISYSNISLAGTIKDDYGFSRLEIKYRINDEKQVKAIPLEIDLKIRSQSYFLDWNITSLQLQPEDQLTYYVAVKDNDGINGAKEARSANFSLKKPSKGTLDAILSKKASSVQEMMSESAELNKNLSEQIEELKSKLKSERKFDWQERQMLKDLLKNKESVQQKISNLQKENNELNQSDENLRQNEQLSMKSERIQELLEQLSDPEINKFYEELEKLLEDEKADADKAQKALDQLQKSEKNVKKDLERALELFKRLKMETALARNLEKLSDLSKRQEDLSKDNIRLKDAVRKQDQIKSEYDDFQQEMDEIRKMNQELKKPQALQDNLLEERRIAKELQDILKKQEDQKSESGANQKNQSKAVQEMQKKTAKQMKKLSEQLNAMQGGMQMQAMQENLDQLRNILDDLIKLSFNQEEIMTTLREVQQSDPRFLTLSQRQLKLKDDGQVIQDSLLSLASRVAELSAFINREIGNINENIGESLEFLKDRNRNRAVTSQQFTMTAINNLALLLDDTMQNMQMQMSQSQSGQGDQKKPNQGLPDLQKAQEQLGQDMQNLKKGQKSGQQLSEELARLAAQQEMIRQQLQQIRENLDGQPGNSNGSGELKKAIEMMEQNEIDLVNKRITQQLINRQEPILSKMLEADKAQREQDTEEERESKSGSMISREIPPKFEEYLKLRKQEVELLRTIPLELTPFYKKEVNEYYRRLSTEDKDD